MAKLCQGCVGMYGLQNITELMLGSKGDGMFLWDGILAELLGFQKKFFAHQKLSMFHMAAVLSFSVTTEFC